MVVGASFYALAGRLRVDRALLAISVCPVLGLRASAGVWGARLLLRWAKEDPRELVRYLRSTVCGFFTVKEAGKVPLRFKLVSYMPLVRIAH